MTLKIFAIVFFLIIGGTSFAQTRSTKEAKVILIINEKNTKIIGLELFDKKDAKDVKNRYPDSKFYIGLLRGRYELEKEKVVPNVGATIIIYTDRQFFPNEEFFPNENFVPGNRLDLGGARAKILSNNKGELVLKTQ